MLKAPRLNPVAGVVDVVVVVGCVEGMAKENPAPPNAAPADVVAGLDPASSPPRREVEAVVVVAETGAPPNLKPNINMTLSMHLIYTF